MVSMLREAPLAKNLGDEVKFAAQDYTMVRIAQFCP